MAADFWNPIREASICLDSDGTPKFNCSVVTSRYGHTRDITIYLDERTTRKAVVRKFTENISDHELRDIKPVFDRIVDDLFDKFGASGVLEWNPRVVDECNAEWAVRLIRCDLKKRGIPGGLPRERLDRILDELYVIEPVLEP